MNIDEKNSKGKTARLIVTMDTPIWYYFLVNKGAGHTIMKKCILEFCGVKPVRIQTIGPVKPSTEEKRKKWLQSIQLLGEKMI